MTIPVSVIMATIHWLPIEVILSYYNDSFSPNYNLQ